MTLIANGSARKKMQVALNSPRFESKHSDGETIFQSMMLLNENNGHA
jgi:hypothetical protein